MHYHIILLPANYIYYKVRVLCLKVVYLFHRCWKVNIFVIDLQLDSCFAFSSEAHNAIVCNFSPDSISIRFILSTFFLPYLTCALLHNPSTSQIYLLQGWCSAPQACIFVSPVMESQYLCNCCFVFMGSFLTFWCRI